MTDYKSYNLTLLIPISLLLAATLSVALYMEPHSGELTRMGGYLENDFGWNLPQQQFLAPLFTKAKSLNEYDQYFDVVVLGDSFSDDLVRGWQNYVVQKTGWSVISFNMNELSLDKIIDSDVYRKTPPKFFIYETIERNTIARLTACDNEKKLVDQIVESKERISPVVKTDTAVWASRARTPKLRFANFGAAVNYLSKALPRALFSLNNTEVHQFDLSRDGLFSSAVNSRMLVIDRDFEIKGVTKQQVATARCNLLELQAQIQRSGQTAFSVLIFPDKTSAYADYILDADYRSMSILTDFEQTPGLNIAKLKTDFENAVRNGVIDLYLPNDTHCGFYGYQLAAEAVLDTMVRAGWMQTKPAK